jgi:hypothetical protein
VALNAGSTISGRKTGRGVAARVGTSKQGTLTTNPYTAPLATSTSLRNSTAVSNNNAVTANTRNGAVPITTAAGPRSAARATTYCSLCNTVGHTGRDCKENLLQQLEKQRREKDNGRRLLLLDEESEDDDKQVVRVDITQEDIQEEVELPNNDEDFFSLIGSMRES